MQRLRTQMAERISLVNSARESRASPGSADAQTSTAPFLVSPIGAVEMDSPIDECLSAADPPGKVLVDFMQRRGRRIYECCGALWHSVEAGILISCPYDSRLSPDPDTIHIFLQSTKAPAVRFPSLSWEG